MWTQHQALLVCQTYLLLAKPLPRNRPTDLMGLKRLLVPVYGKQGGFIPRNLRAQWSLCRPLCSFRWHQPS